MGSLLAVAAGMRTIGLLITLLAVSPQAATDQKLVVPEGTVIASAQVTGFDIERLSPGLRQEIRDLAGTPLKQQRLDELAARLEAERPRYVAAGRAVMDSDGQVRVFFVMGRQSVPERDDNVNARYIVEQADIIGVPDAELTQALRDDLQALVGKRLDSGDADRLQERMERELPRYEISRRILRGSEVGRIRLVYEARKAELPQWLRFEPLRSNAIFHSDQGWGSYLDLGIGNRNIRFTPIIAIDNADDLVEEYSGYGLRFETRKIGTRRLGASLEWSRFDHDWRGATLDVLALAPEIPRPYETRSTITPLLKFAFSADLSVAAGVSISELEPLFPATASQMANAAVASIGYDRRWPGGFDARTTSRPASACAQPPANSKVISSTGGISGRARIDTTSDATTCRRPEWREASPVTRRSSNGSRSVTRPRSAAGTSTTSRRRVATACSTRRSNIAIPDSRSSSISVRSGTRAPSARSASRRVSVSTPGRRSWSLASR